MIKTVKVKKKMRLDELIKYIYEKKLISKEFNADGESPMNVKVKVNKIGEVTSYGYAAEDRFFTVEVEEEITEDTEFEAFVIITDKGILKSINNYHNMRAVRGLLENYEVEQKIYALIDNNLELIWEAIVDGN